MMRAHTAEDALRMSLYFMATFGMMKAHTTEDANQMSVSSMAYTLNPPSPDLQQAHED